MALSDLQAHLEQNFQPPAAGQLDAVIRLAVAGESLVFEVRHGRLRFAPELVPDATFFFDDEATAWDLLTGRADAFAAFMQGRFRSDGHLMWAFALMAMFGSRSLPDAPTE